jgi:hypothetical protein
MNKVLVTTLLFFISIASIAQVEPIETDRPVKTLTPFTVPKKWIQFETGLSRQSDKYDQSYTEIYLEHPTFLLKYGLAKCFELRLITDVATIQDQFTSRTYSHTGINNVQLGGKLIFLKEKGIRPATALIAHYRFNGLRTIYKGKDSIDGANFKLAMKHTLSKKIALQYNVGMEWRRFGSNPAFVYSISPRINFNEKWFAYLEAFGFIWNDRDPQNSIDGGVAFTINGDLTIDASAGIGLSKEAPDNFFSIGASFRFNTGR